MINDGHHTAHRPARLHTGYTGERSQRSADRRDFHSDVQVGGRGRSSEAKAKKKVDDSSVLIVTRAKNRFMLQMKHAHEKTLGNIIKLYYRLYLQVLPYR